MYPHGGAQFLAASPASAFVQNSGGGKLLGANQPEISGVGAGFATGIPHKCCYQQLLMVHNWPRQRHLKMLLLISGERLRPRRSPDCFINFHVYASPKEIGQIKADGLRQIFCRIGLGIVLPCCLTDQIDGQLHSDLCAGEIELNCLLIGIQIGD